MNVFRFIPLLLLFFLPFYSKAAESLRYNRDIRPILSDKCFQCHGPDSGKRKGDLRLDIREDALKAKAFIEGTPEESELVKRLNSHDPEEIMPPPQSPRQLSEVEKATLHQWIKEGAVYEPHWSFVPLPAGIQVPEVKHQAWPVNAIDNFVLSTLETEGLEPTAPAAPERWLRRVTFDLTGLPPTSSELVEFLADKASDAREEVINRLLASPRMGEKMAVDWLDAARYADSFGYQSDMDTNAWPYRDWVIDAFNKNLPWDQFVTWQIAGDLLPNATREQRVATAFNRVHRKTQEGGSVEAEYRQEGIADRVHTFGTAFLALTFECTRCHDHKYDPLTMKDYYSMGAFFNSIDEWGLLHGNGSIQPNPSLFLTTPQQDAAIAKQREAIANAEAGTLKQRAELEPSFQAWLQAPTAPMADLKASCDLDVAENNKFSNAATPDKPAQSDAHNQLVAGHRGQALSFTGDHALKLDEFGIGDQENPLSMAFWLKPAELAKRTIIFHNSGGYDPGYNGFELLLEDGKLRWMVAREWPGNCIAIKTKNAIPKNEWTHLTVTYDGSSKAAGLKIFINGSQAESETLRDQLTKNCGSGSGFSFGERVRDSGLRGGAVDDIRLYDRAITALEISALQADRSLEEQIKIEPRDEAGISRLRDYYFSAVNDQSRKSIADLLGLRSSLRKIFDGVRELPVMEEMQEARPAYVLNRGAYDAPKGDPLPRITPAVLPSFPADQPKNRLGLARWLTQPDHPLTARVQVNRFWLHFFGRGLVSTAENFGSQGELPSHPELLDWLARDFVSHGWDVKRLLKEIVLSATYGQDSKASPTLREKDPLNILLARGPVKRLAAEDLRDQSLALSGLLQPTIGGPSVKPYLPEAATWRALNGFLPEYKRDAAPAIYRRSMYTFWRRTAQPPGMMAFDAAGREVCSVKRQQTNTPLQPLVMLNDPQFVEASRALAIRMLKEGGQELKSRVRWLFREALNREPKEEESRLLIELFDTQWAEFNQDPLAAAAYLKVGDMPPATEFSAPLLAASTTLANAVLNLDESITLR